MVSSLKGADVKKVISSFFFRKTLLSVWNVIIVVICLLHQVTAVIPYFGDMMEDEQGEDHMNLSWRAVEEMLMSVGVDQIGAVEFKDDGKVGI